MRKLLPALIAWAMLWGAACSEIETYDPQPRVEFIKVYLADTLDGLGNQVKLQRIHLEVIDGDGNLGLSRGDSAGCFSPDSVGYKNLYISVLSKNAGGKYEELAKVSENMGYRIPYKEPIGQNKYMKAEVIVKAEVPAKDLDCDTIRYDFFVYDRLMNRSATASSCDIPLGLHGTVWADGRQDAALDSKETESR